MSNQVSLSGTICIPADRLSKKQLCEQIASDIIRINQLEVENSTLKEKVTNLETENKRLQDDSNMLRTIINNNEIEITSLKSKIKKLEDDKLRLDAIMKLYECDAIANNAFKNSYRKWFKLPFKAPAPDLGDFVGEEISSKEYPDDYAFWIDFKTRYPGTDNPQFQKIYIELNVSRASFAHPKVVKLPANEFDRLAKIVFEDYDANKNIYDSYRNWLYLF